ncbi:hypothetical protein F3T97_25695 [Escherichia coli]|nr:hypothetical protein [Escherichia coli]RXC39976.1 hypothetical protein EPS71_24960 [Escherichia coli]HAH4943470.1 hypothetical protein [Escherichia coli]HAJ0204130.1 hypothetical protein [Escherichia coli]
MFSLPTPGFPGVFYNYKPAQPKKQNTIKTMNYIKLNDIFVRRFTFRNIGVSLDIENYCTVSLFFEQATLSQ